MFQSRTATQCGQKEIIWNDRVVFLLSLFPEEGKTESLMELCGENTAVICVKGEMAVEQPCFGPQKYYDPKKGMGYQLKLPGFCEAVAIYQHKDWWVRPAFVKNSFQVPERTQLLLFKREDTYFAVLAVCGEECRTDISGPASEKEDAGTLLIRTASNAGNRKCLKDISLVLSAEKDPYLCCENAVKAALSYMGKESMLRKNKAYPEMFEYFGWCSWDAFYHQVSHQGILDKMQEFKEKKIPVKWVLIDDGWLDADYENALLSDLDAKKSQFPKGLSGCSRELKEKYGVKKVGVWHAVMGYWNGLKEGSEAAKKLAGGVRRLPDQRLLPAPEAEKAFLFYDSWHEYLKNVCGIDFIKVDGQSAISLAYGGLETYGSASREIQKGLNASAALHFENNIINCMGMASEDMWNRPSSAIARSSDDFVPKEKDGFREHLIQNGFNNLLQGQFYWGDYDMFYSKHEESLSNSMLRCVSGGPVYVSDQVGESEETYILPLIKADGRVIRCEGTGVPTADCLLEDPAAGARPLKIFNSFRDKYVVAAFNICNEEKEAEGTLSIKDIPGLGGKKWMAYSHRGRKISRLEEGKDVTVTVPFKEAELYLLLPEEGLTAIGILEKYISCGCMETLWEREEGKAFLVSEKGTFGFYSPKEPEQVRINGILSEWKALGEGLYSALVLKEDSVVEIDMEKQ